MLPSPDAILYVYMHEDAAFGIVHTDTVLSCMSTERQYGLSLECTWTNHVQPSLSQAPAESMQVCALLSARTYCSFVST